jgi:hypothetical protein
MAFTPLIAELTNPTTRAAMMFAVNREPKFLWVQEEGAALKVV